ncbi:prephenate dehydratase [Paenibacillus jilunlii]|uniref:Prephenate dehydratase n=1 Tax=Paenibacillus jilunlii TaxID=682956 RepID=A0A1G9S1C0_9BACL|nr:prephenate dehydratase [Paenibacillus jilunlii]KWX77723.1 prephenate dehydratase [Paenibacillus jilunlii]SDM29060.1 prephenate dehydratase [Paenibacillus jilunlii]
MKSIAVLPQGSVSHEALLHLFGDEPVNIEHHKLISNVFLATANGVTDYSVIPIENTIEGSVSLHIDWLINEVNLPMQAEWIFPSIQNLIGNPKEFTDAEGHKDYTKVVKILSHPVAMAQCLQFIRDHAPWAELESVGSTSEAVEIVSNNPGKGWAAIGTALGAATHGLEVVERQVTDHNNNFTRFVLVGHQKLELPRKSSGDKTSILVTLPEDFPGALHQVLAAFAWRRLNLSRIESRPTKKKLGTYYFYIDVMEPIESVLLPGAIEEIKALGCQVRILGSYPTYTYEEEKAEVQ